MEVLKGILSLILSIFLVLLIVGLGVAAFVFTAAIIPFVIGLAAIIIVAAGIYDFFFRKD